MTAEVLPSYSNGQNTLQSPLIDPCSSTAFPVRYLWMNFAILRQIVALFNDRSYFSSTLSFLSQARSSISMRTYPNLADIQTHVHEESDLIRIDMALESPCCVSEDKKKRIKFEPNRYLRAFKPIKNIVVNQHDVEIGVLLVPSRVHYITSERRFFLFQSLSVIAQCCVWATFVLSAMAV